ncbi:MAG: hypothetical protein BGO97_14920 [Micrococcales bacterium 70-64]|nr:hypothetical protein [Leifsonia sp.]ODU65201.1 MAG: hypothetical protein ABT06_14920 [Leifsonia sp. SCN 70-46]OJX86893.1 MAG: hypothetical protein BGO97_14920 [Micrococcales bacterium 70-64]
MDPQALDLATKTLAAAIDALMASGTPFAPLLNVQRGGATELRKVPVGKGQDASTVARALAAGEPGADATAFAVSGIISYGGTSMDGIVVEAWNFHTNRGARVGLRYELKGALRKKASLIGSPLHLGRRGWFDPEEGEPAETPTFPEPTSLAPAVVASAPLPAPAAPATPAAPPAPVAEPEGFGPPPEASQLAPADEAPPPPASAAASSGVPPELPRVFSSPADFPPPVLTAPEQLAEPLPDFGPPPTTAPVPGWPPPGSAEPPRFVVPVEPLPVAAPEPAPVPVPAPEPVAPPAPQPVAESWPAPVIPAEPVAEAPRPVQPSIPVPEVVPEYTPVPIQRNETPLGNRAMFAGVMELATRSRSFPAFAIVERDGAWEQVTMTDPSLDQAAASVRAYARSRTDADFIAFAVDGFVPVGDTTVPAVIVEVWEYATRKSFSVAQRYVPTGDPPSPRLSGRPLMRTQAGWIDVPSAMSLGGQVQFGYRDPDSA